jgi:serine/threonine-protein kinase
MSLVAGTRLGPYEIQAAIGAGGMGEVYKARDTRLDRTVAIKILPGELSADPDRRTRFEREARAIAALNHPHICTLHDIGTHEGTTYLVMEHLPGQTLADRLLKGPLPLPQALDVAVQIAEALDAAHKHGIIHRDLKPGNVMLTSSGAGRSGVVTAKLLDFGLAKLARHGERPAIESQTHMPTQAAPVTAQGTILGTLQYMAPEQLEGREADTRTDLWALGAILYEMLTGRRAFEGESQASLITAIMSSQPPPVSAVQPITPSALERVVDRCLAKDPDARWQNASDLAAELAWLAGDSTRPAVAAPGGAPMRAARRWPLAAVVLAVALAVGAGAALWRWWNPPNVRPLRVALPVSSWNLALDTTPGGLALSPDGQTVVFSANRPGEPSQLWVRRANDMEPRPLAGTQFARLPFFSPDGQHVAFATSYGAVVRVPLAGGSPQQVWAPAPEFEGGAWGNDGTIVFAGGYVRPGLFYVSAEGGAASKALYEAPADGRGGRYAFPEILPDGQTILFTIRSTRGARVHAWSPERGVKPITEGARARYVSTGHLLYEDGETLRLVGFDATRLAGC